jgi:hypothetical protein
MFMEFASALLEYRWRCARWNALWHVAYQELPDQVKYLQVESEILRCKWSKRITIAPKEQRRLQLESAFIHEHEDSFPPAPPF